MIEEIDSTSYNKHYLEKVYLEVGSNPEAFLAAALEYLAQETAFFKQPDAFVKMAQLAQRHIAAASSPGAAAPPMVAAVPAPMAMPPAAAPAAVAPAAAAAPSAAAATAPPAQPPLPVTEPVAAPAQQQPGHAAANENEQEEEEEEEQQQQEEPKGIKPNAGNGADMGTHSWTQTLGEVVVSVPVPPGTKGRACDVAISRDKLRIGIKGQSPVLDGALYAPIKPDDCLWNLVDGRQLEVTLQKKDGMQWWKSVLLGEPEIDVQKVEPEPSKLEDLEPDMRATVEKMMYDQRQKAMGLPTSEEEQKLKMLEKFKAQHPEMDFSNAKIEM